MKRAVSRSRKTRPAPTWVACPSARCSDVTRPPARPHGRPRGPHCPPQRPPPLRPAPRRPPPLLVREPRGRPSRPSTPPPRPQVCWYAWDRAAVHHPLFSFRYLLQTDKVEAEKYLSMAKEKDFLPSCKIQRNIAMVLSCRSKTGKLLIFFFKSKTWPSFEQI